MTIMHSNCLGVVLAGGLSSRMGKNKAQLMRNNTSMLDFSKELLLNAGVENIVISGSHAENNVLKAQHQVTDIVAQAGPMGGIYSVIARYKPKALLVLPVDLPLMTVSALTKLKQVAELSGKACFFEDHNIPLYLPVTAFVEMFLQKTFLSQDFKQTGKGPSIRSLLKQIPHQAIKADDAQLLFNTNTPEQWQQAQSLFARQSINKKAFSSNVFSKKSLGSL